MGNQIEQIVEKVPSLKRISFVAHSLGGVFSRYAVAVLYTPKDDLEDLGSRGEEHPVFRRRREPKIAGLEAVNFVTLASPHLGVRGRKQVSGDCRTGKAYWTSWFSLVFHFMQTTEFF